MITGPVILACVCVRVTCPVGVSLPGLEVWTVGWRFVHGTVVYMDIVIDG